MSLLDFNMRATEELIEEVKKRPILWNKNVENYNNRSSMRAEWKQLANVLKKDKDLIKQKWRNLRDQFIRELKKTKIPHECEDQPLMDYYNGRWIYFKDLVFLKEYTTEKKKKNTSNDSEDVDKITYNDIKEEIFFEEPTSSSSIEPEEHNALEDESVAEPNVEVVVWPQNLYQEEHRQRKKKRETDRLGQSKKLAVEIDEDIDEDLYFVKSLVPFLRKLNPVRKLIVRNEIQSLLIKEMLCEKCRVNGPQSMCKCDGTL